MQGAWSRLRQNHNTLNKIVRVVEKSRIIAHLFESLEIAEPFGVRMMRIYGLKNCDTCRKAMKAFPDATLVDVRAQGVPQAVLERAHAQFGSALVNTRSTTWRGLSEEQRTGNPMELLGAHPALMKRPLIEVGDRLCLSWNSELEGELKALL